MEENQNQYNKPPKKPMNPAIVIVSVICGCIMFLGFWMIFFGQLFGNLFSGLSSTASTYSQPVPYGNTIDVIKVEGTIASGSATYQHQWTLQEIDRLIASDTNKAIMLYVNSPGGGIYESDELYLKLKEYKETTKRPVYAYMAQTAASGGLYITMAADKIYANRMTMTGSIGVIMSLTDTTGLQELIGIKEENVVSGKNKSMGNPLTTEQRQILQSMVDESYDIFVDIVAEGRSLPREKVIKLADGRVYSAKQAQEAGLIDEVASYEDALASLVKDHNLQDCNVYAQTPPTSFINEILYGMESNLSDSKAKSLEKINEYIEANNMPKIMYYMQ